MDSNTYNNHNSNNTINHSNDSIKIATANSSILCALHKQQQDMRTCLSITNDNLLKALRDR